MDYARHIQEAILPRKERLGEIFSEAFVINMPRDIVSGDFYWFAKRHGKVFIDGIAHDRMSTSTGGLADDGRPAEMLQIVRKFLGSRKRVAAGQHVNRLIRTITRAWYLFGAERIVDRSRGLIVKAVEVHRLVE